MSIDLQAKCPHDDSDLIVTIAQIPIEYRWRKTDELFRTDQRTVHEIMCTAPGRHAFSNTIDKGMNFYFFNGHPDFYAHPRYDQTVFNTKNPALNAANISEIKESRAIAAEQVETSAHITACTITAITFLANWMLRR